MDNFFNRNENLVSTYHDSHFSKEKNYYDAYIKVLEYFKQSCKESLKELFKTNENFKLEIDEYSANSLPLNISEIEGPSKVLTFLNSNKSSLKYKFTVERGDKIYSSLFYRQPRLEYLNLIKNKLKNYDWGGLNVAFDVVKDVDGGNPRIKLVINFTRKTLSKGKIKITQKAINFVFYIKYSSKKVTAEYSKGLSPIALGLTNQWMSYEEIKKKTLNFIKSEAFPFSKFDNIVNMYENIVNDAVNNSSQIIINTNILSDMPSEFFEILSAIRISKELSENDTKTKKILGISDDLSPDKIFVKIPSKSNFKLVDYFISLNGIPKNSEDYNGIRVSVKKSLSGGVSNTVKFAAIFDKKSEVNEWYKSMSRKLRTEQISQKIVAYDSVSVGTYYPIEALYNLLNSNNQKSRQVKNDLKKYCSGALSQNDDYQKFEKCLGKISKVVRRYDKNKKISKMESGKLNDAEKKIIDDFFDRLIENNSSRFKYFKDDKKRNIKYLTFFCEKVLELSTKKSSDSKINFYKLFYDNVLCSGKNQPVIGYSVFNAKEQSGHIILKYGLYSKINFASEYKDWISLRSKHKPGSEALGMAV